MGPGRTKAAKKEIPDLRGVRVRVFRAGTGTDRDRDLRRTAGMRGLRGVRAGTREAAGSGKFKCKSGKCGLASLESLEAW